jgi:hypothetical protein
MSLFVLLFRLATCKSRRMNHIPVSPVSRKGTMSSNVKAINPHFDFIFSHPRASLFSSETLDGFLIVICALGDSFFLHQQALIRFCFTTFSRESLFGCENHQLFSFQEVAYLSMVSWHNLISPRHKATLKTILSLSIAADQKLLICFRSKFT